MAMRAKGLSRRTVCLKGSPPTFSNKPSTPFGKAAFNSAAKSADR